ncbi:hypothetical protein, partial [Streptomyces parvus]
PAEAIEPDEPLADLGFDAPGLQELGEAIGVRPTPGPDSTVAELAALAEGDEAGGGARGGGGDRFHALTDLAYTSQVGRTPMAHRLAVIASDLPELRAALR